MANVFNCVKMAARCEYIEQNSKFIAYLRSISSEKDAKKIISDLKKEHPHATHLCYGFVTYNGKSKTERQSDDKEPAGTAGTPILNILRKKNICNAIIVVVRYFGGTLLGAGGLIRAYTEAAGKVAKDSNLTTCQFKNIYKFEADYTEAKKIESFAKKNDVSVVDEDYGEVVTFLLAFKEENFKAACEALNNELGRKVTLKFVENRLV